jgi:integrase
MNSSTSAGRISGRPAGPFPGFRAGRRWSRRWRSASSPRATRWPGAASGRSGSTRRPRTFSSIKDLLDYDGVHAKDYAQREWRILGRGTLDFDAIIAAQSGDVLPLPDICLTALELTRSWQQAAKEAVGERWKPVRVSPSGISSDGLVFTTASGTNRDPRNFNRSFNSRCDKAGVRRIRVRDTRHTCASLLAALDVHPRVAMAILRHAQISITTEVYNEVPDAVTRAALKRLGDQVGRREPDGGHYASRG